MTNKPHIDLSRMNADELLAFWKTHRLGRKASCLAVCGSWGPQEKILTQRVASYAWNMRWLIINLEKGDETGAEMRRQICSNIAPELPDTITI